ncbi:MAG: hypothetical protein ABEJ08_06020 [Halobacteriaceae archaeon]
MRLADTIPDSPDADLSVEVVNRRQARPVQDLLERLFDRQPVTVEAGAIPATDEDVVLLAEVDEAAALVATEQAPGTWRGYWTDDGGRSRSIC